MTTQQTRLGIDAPAASAISYLLGPITGVLLLLLEPEHPTVRFHAMQSTVTFGSLFILQAILPFLPILGWLALVVLGPASLVLWLVLMVRAYQGRGIELPLFGALARTQIARLS